MKKLSPQELEEQTPDILGNHSNSYTITKHMAEHEIKKLEQEVPCAIVRPSMSEYFITKIKKLELKFYNINDLTLIKLRCCHFFYISWK